MSPLFNHDWMPLPVAIAWVALWTIASLVYRLWRRKPLFAPPAQDALFTQSWTSGHSNKNSLTRIGGASNCLRVTVTPAELQIRPHFPFTLLFLPEIFDLDFGIPRSHIISVQRRRRLFCKALLIHYKAPGRESCSVELSLRRPQEFLDALGLRASV